MNQLKEYRLNKGMTQNEIVAEIKKVYPKMTIPLYSQIETEVIAPPLAVEEWLMCQGGIKVKKFEPNELAVLNALNEAEEPITREGLKDITKLTDRDNRKIIESLRNRGYWVINEGQGYFITDDVNKYQAWRRVYTAKARSIFKTVGAMDSKPIRGQMELMNETNN